MPHAVSQKQYRLMKLIAEGKVDPSKTSGRGVPPKEVAEKYVSATSDTKNLPESHGENRGGSWTNKHHAAHHKKQAKEHGDKSTKLGREHRKQASAHLKQDRRDFKKSFEEFYKNNDLAARKFAGKDKAAATIVINNDGKILLGKHKGGLSFPGGHMDPEDMGDFAITALRELKEEAGIIGRNPIKVWEGEDRGNYVMVYLIESWTGKPQYGDDLGPLQWVDPKDIKWSELRGCCRLPLKQYIESKLGKSIRGMIALENLSKNIIRQKGDAVLEVTHGDSLRLIGTGLFRIVRDAVRDMQDEDFREVRLDSYVLNIRRHMSDIYSGRVSDGHKVIYQFTNKSLPELTAALMSLFEWYLPEDEPNLDLLDDTDVDDTIINGGVQTLIENYRKHNIGNIYEEMESIRQQIRNGTAVDLQQVEARMMKLFDKLEDSVRDTADKHNKLSELTSQEIDSIEQKLRDLQSKLDNLNKLPDTIEAFTSHKVNPNRVHDEGYPYLPYPKIEIRPNGKIKISFGSEWGDLEKKDFLTDLKAKVIKKHSK